MFPELRVNWKRPLYLWGRGKVWIHSKLPSLRFVGLQWVYIAQITMFSNSWFATISFLCLLGHKFALYLDIMIRKSLHLTGWGSYSISITNTCFFFFYLHSLILLLSRQFLLFYKVCNWGEGQFKIYGLFCMIHSLVDCLDFMFDLFLLGML